MFRRVQLLALVARKQNGDRGWRQVQVARPLGDARIGKVDVQPKPSIAPVVDRLIDGQRLADPSSWMRKAQTSAGTMP